MSAEFYLYGIFFLVVWFGWHLVRNAIVRHRPDSKFTAWALARETKRRARQRQRARRRNPQAGYSYDPDWAPGAGDGGE